MGKYFFRYRNREHDSHPTLVEMTAQEARDELAKAEGTGWEYRPLHATQAHDWVRNGGHHETYLFIDSDGRIRSAKE